MNLKMKILLFNTSRRNVLYASMTSVSRKGSMVFEFCL